MFIYNKLEIENYYEKEESRVYDLSLSRLVLDNGRARLYVLLCRCELVQSEAKESASPANNLLYNGND